MRFHRHIAAAVLMAVVLVSCGNPAGDDGGNAVVVDTRPPASTAAATRESAFNATGPMPSDAAVVFLHHSTGANIWNGGVPEWVASWNTDYGTSYTIVEQAFPKSSPYGWQNYPYDYWNIWVNHAGDVPYKEEPTLEILTGGYDVIVWKHCYPVSDIGPDTGTPDIASSAKRLENYYLQYEALKEAMHDFPGTRFVVWTGAARVRSATTEEKALRAREFFTWVRTTWDEPGDNIFIWDFWELETEGGLYLLDEYASSSGDSHPGPAFSRRAASDLAARIVDVIEGRGDGAPTLVDE